EALPSILARTLECGSPSRSAGAGPRTRPKGSILYARTPMGLAADIPLRRAAHFHFGARTAALGACNRRAGGSVQCIRELVPDVWPSGIAGTRASRRRHWKRSDE